MPPRPRRKLASACEPCGRGIPAEIGKVLIPHLRNISADALEKSIMPLLVKKIRGRGAMTASGHALRAKKKARKRKLK